MRLRLLLSAYGLFMIVTGTALFAIPGLLSELYPVWSPTLDWSPTLVEITLARSLGGLMVGVGAMSWAARTETRRGTRDPLLFGLVVINALWTAVCVWTALATGHVWFFWAEGAAFAGITILFAVSWTRAATGTY